MKLVSFVIPCYRSEATIAAVTEQISQKMKHMPAYEHEIILVNDCSPDGTLAVISGLAKEDGRITVVDLARNFGQHAAIMAGLRHTAGDIIVCLDDDGQTPPEQADRLLKALEDGADVAYARYASKKHSFFRNFGSRVNDKMMDSMLDKPKDLAISSYFAAKRFVVDEMLRYENAYPYVMGLVLRSTANIVNVDIDHKERASGSSGYSISKLLSLWFNGFTAFSVKPLRIATLLGVLSSLAGFIYGIVIVIQHFVLPERVLGFASIVALLVFFGGLILITLGLIGEYVGRIYLSLNNTPQYVIRKVIKKGEADEQTA